MRRCDTKNRCARLGSGRSGKIFRRVETDEEALACDLASASLFLKLVRSSAPDATQCDVILYLVSDVCVQSSLFQQGSFKLPILYNLYSYMYLEHVRYKNIVFS